MRTLEFGWFLPTAGDSEAFGAPEANIEVTPEYLLKVVRAAEAAHFDYLLIPVDQRCWEAYIAGAFVAAATNKMKPLIAARPGYINPFCCQMISPSTIQWQNLCQSDCRSESEIQAEGIRYEKKIVMR